MMLRMEHIDKAFDGNAVLHDLCWTLEPGECWQVTGASGIGKTTLLRLMMGLEQPDSGKRIVSAAVRFCPVFQEDRLVENWNALQNVALVCDDSASAFRILSALLPDSALEQPVCTLSGGMRRRVSLARALAAQGDILVLDEPFAGLDAQTLRHAAEVLRRYRRGRAVVLVSHGTEKLFPDWHTLAL